MSEYYDNNTAETGVDREEGQITYANEVVSTIASVATTEVEGISEIIGSNGSLSGIIGRGRLPKGVKVDIRDNVVRVDISVTVDYGIPIQKVGRNCQENVRKSIETMTGLSVDRIDLHVVGVSFEKENKEMQQSQKLALTLEEEEEQTAAVENNVEVEYSEESSTEELYEEGTDLEKDSEKYQDNFETFESDKADNLSKESEDTENTDDSDCSVMDGYE